MSESVSILVVDDNLSMAKSLKDVLELKGYMVYSAGSGMEALEILGDHPVDIMVTDVIMAEMNGVALHRKARKTYPKLTTFLMTAYSADDLIQEGMREGIKTVLNKPVDMDLLLLLLSISARGLQ